MPNEPLGISNVNSLKVLMFYVGEYCTISLEALSIKNLPMQFLDSFERPFLNITSIEIKTFGLHERLNENWFHQMFPNVKYLSYESLTGRFNNYKCIINRFKNLECLDIGNGGIRCRHHFGWMQITNDQYTTQNGHILSILKKNPQLKTIRLSNISNYNFVCKIKEYQPLLENLHFQYATNHGSSINVSPVRFSNIRKLEMTFCKPNRCPIRMMEGRIPELRFPIMDDDMYTIPLLLDNLEDLTFQTCFNYSNKFFEFIENHKTIVRLHLATCCCPQFISNINKWKLIQALPMLKVLYCEDVPLKVDDIIDFTTSFPSLEKIFFKLFESEDDDDLAERLSPEWMGTSIPNTESITLVRRL